MVNLLPIFIQLPPYYLKTDFFQESSGRVASSGKILQIPRDVMTDLAPKSSQSGKSSIPCFETLKIIKVSAS